MECQVLIGGKGAGLSSKFLPETYNVLCCLALLLTHCQAQYALESYNVTSGVTSYILLKSEFNQRRC